MQTWDVVIRSGYLVRRWWWLVVLSGIVCGLTAGYLVYIQPPQYSTRTTLMVGTNLRSPNPRENASGVSMTLAAFYAEMARRSPITDPVIQRLQLPFSSDVLQQYMLTTRVIPQAQLIEIAVQDTNPDRAARIANALAEQLINYSPTSPDKIEAQRKFTQAQLSELEAKIKRSDGQIQELNTQLANMTSAGEISEAQQRLNELSNIKSADQATYTNLLGNLNDSSINSLSMFEPAVIPTIPLPRRLFPTILLATLLGGVIGLAAAWAIDAMDDHWRRGRQPEFVIGETTLGRVSTEWMSLITDAALQLPRGRQCLQLRSEVLQRIAPTSRYTIMVTSAKASFERSKLSSDLARLFARTGQHVLLIDANMGEDYIATAFGITGDGVQSLLRAPDHPLSELVERTDQPNLFVLPGNSGGQSAHLVPTLHWPRAVEAIEREAELAVFDGPPVLEGADATLLAPHMGGVVLVIDPATEYCSETRKAIARLREINAPLLGVALLSYDRRRPPLPRPTRASAPAGVSSAIR